MIRRMSSLACCGFGTRLKTARSLREASRDAVKDVMSQNLAAPLLGRTLDALARSGSGDFGPAHGIEMPQRAYDDDARSRLQRLATADGMAVTSVRSILGLTAFGRPCRSHN